MRLVILVEHKIHCSSDLEKLYLTQRHKADNVSLTLAFETRLHFPNQCSF